MVHIKKALRKGKDGIGAVFLDGTRSHLQVSHCGLFAHHDAAALSARGCCGCSQGASNWLMRKGFGSSAIASWLQWFFEQIGLSVKTWNKKESAPKDGPAHCSKIGGEIREQMIGLKGDRL